MTVSNPNPLHMPLGASGRMGASLGWRLIPTRGGFSPAYIAHVRWFATVTSVPDMPSEYISLVIHDLLATYSCLLVFLCQREGTWQPQVSTHVETLNGFGRINHPINPK